jgi:UDP-GlcNAc:undecaprenyl-phosphate/decaprenyl-phosphate GlcNAc-1-phosphate transferase
MTFLFTFVLAFLFVLALIPAIIYIARRRGWFDTVGGRKIHTGNIPRLGGVGIALGFLASYPLSLFLVRSIYPTQAPPSLSFWVLFASGYGFHLLGLVDDFKDLKGRLKFLFQFLLALCVVLAGYSFKKIEIPVAPYKIELGLLGPAITVFWIIGISNAMNLIDGMDGLSGGIALIGSGVWAMLYLKSGQNIPALAAVAAGGACLGFLFYNFPPASIFMGDSGSLFLGYLFAVMPLMGSGSDAVETGLIPAVTICLIPLMDTFAAIIRRWRSHVSFFTADKYHLHHKLLNLGFAPRQILAIIYGLCTILGFATLTSVYVSPVLSFWLMLGGWVVVASIFVLLHFLKERHVRLIKALPESK